MDIEQGDTLNKKTARAVGDTVHIAPLQKESARRIIELYSNPGELVATPFAGIGTELVMALREGREAWGCELKESYFVQAIRNIKAMRSQGSLEF